MIETLALETFALTDPAIMKKIANCIEISKDIFMPIIGIGTWEMRNKDVLFNVIDAGFEAGYRFIDTAHVYQNEKYIGPILKELLPKHNLTRGDIFITSKMPTSHHGVKARDAFLYSLNALQTDYIDLYLVHFPGAASVSTADHERLKELRRQTWSEMETLYEEGKVKALGVSNYMIKHLEEMSEYAKIKPVVNQCEFHPHNTCSELLNYCKKHGIHFQAYSSLGSAHSGAVLFKEPLVVEMCKKYKCEAAQLLLAWALNQNVSVLPKTRSVERVKSNFQSIDIVMQESDVELLSNLKTSKRYCWDPTTVA